MSRERFEDKPYQYYRKEVNELYDDERDDEEMREGLGKKIIAGHKALVVLIALRRRDLSGEEKKKLLRQGLMEKKLVKRILDEIEIKKREGLEETLIEAMEAVDDFVEQYLPLVISIAKKYNGCSVAFMDLVQDGNIGLIKAAAKYDYRRSKFITHASWWIRQAVVRSIQNNSNTIRLSADTQEKRRLIRKAGEALEQEGEMVTERNISEKSGLSLRTIRRVSGMPGAVSYDGPKTEEDDPDSCLADMAVADNRATETAVEVAMLEELVAEIFDYLPGVDQRFADLLMMRHCETNEKGENLSMREIGERLGGVCRERVRQLLVEAYQLLKDDEFYGPLLRVWLEK